MKKIIFPILFCLIAPLVNAVPPIEAYGHLPSVELVRLSPSGQRFALVAVVGEARRIIVLSDKGEMIFATPTGNSKVRDIEWVGNDRILVDTTSTYDDPFMFVQAYEVRSVANIDLKARTMSFVLGGKRKVANVVLGNAGISEIDGRKYGYFIGFIYEKGMSGDYFYLNDHRGLYQVDLETNETKLVSKCTKGLLCKWVVDRRGVVVAHSTYDDTNGVWRLYVGDEESEPLLEKHSAFGDISLMGFGRTSGSVLLVDDGVTEEVSLTDGKRETLLAGVTPNSYLTDPQDGLALGATIIEPPRATFFDKKLDARYLATRKAFPNSQMELVSFTRNLDRLIVQTHAGNDSGTYWLVDIASGKANPIGYAYPEIRPAHVGSTQMIDYKAADGLEIDAVLTLPPARKAEKLPLIVLPHGGPIGVSDGIIFDWWAQAYASLGYAVLQPNYRGSGGRGKEFELAGYREWGRKMQTDLSDGVATLAAQGLIDSKRVCIVGGSYGGYAALAGVTLQQNIYRCAVSVAGVSDLPRFFSWEAEGHGARTGSMRFWHAVTGADQDGINSVKAISPTYFAEKVNVPVLLIHGKDDTIVPIEQSKLMESALKKAKKQVEFLEMEGEDHWLSREETRKAMLKASAAFVQKYNPPD